MFDQNLADREISDYNMERLEIGFERDREEQGALQDSAQEVVDTLRFELAVDERLATIALL